MALFPLGEEIAFNFVRAGKLRVGTSSGRDPMLDGFGLIALALLTPIIFGMAYGVLI